MELEEVLYLVESVVRREEFWEDDEMHISDMEEIAEGLAGVLMGEILVPSDKKYDLAQNLHLLVSKFENEAKTVKDENVRFLLEEIVHRSQRIENKINDEVE